jgi:hypothetical protein
VGVGGHEASLEAVYHEAVNDEGHDLETQTRYETDLKGIESLVGPLLRQQSGVLIY